MVMITENEITNIPLDSLGYSPFFELNRIKIGAEAFPVARVTAEFKEVYRVKNETGEYMARVTGKHMFTASSREDFPAVGDWVVISKPAGDQATIQSILPRQTIIKRSRGEKNEIQVIAANIDVAFVVESLGRDYNLNRFERYFAMAKEGGVTPAIVLNKIDLASQEELDLILSELKDRFSNIQAVPTSTKTGAGLDELKACITKGKTYCFLGSSGVGKSSLINKLLGTSSIKTENISLRAGRGKHATTHREMYFLENGGIVIDNPGMREIGITGSGEGVANLFNEITALARQCKYSNCTHTHEPGCQVLAAVELGTLEQDKYNNYLSLNKETKYHEMTKYEKREKDRQFGKFMKKAKKELRNYKK